MEKNLGFVRRIYLSRMVGLALGFWMVSTVFIQNAAPAWVWIGPALHCFVDPHLA